MASTSRIAGQVELLSARSLSAVVVLIAGATGVVTVPVTPDGRFESPVAPGRVTVLARAGVL